MVYEKKKKKREMLLKIYLQNRLSYKFWRVILPLYWCVSREINIMKERCKHTHNIIYIYVYRYLMCSIKKGVWIMKKKIVLKVTWKFWINITPSRYVILVCHCTKLYLTDIRWQNIWKSIYSMYHTKYISCNGGICVFSLILL